MSIGVTEVRSIEKAKARYRVDSDPVKAAHTPHVRTILLPYLSPVPGAQVDRCPLKSQCSLGVHPPARL